MRVTSPELMQMMGGSIAAVERYDIEDVMTS
jgi:hypothetical protein